MVHASVNFAARRIAPLFTFLLLAPLLGCSGGDGQDGPPPDPGPPYPEGGLLDYPVDELGPFRVGYRTFLHTYQPKLGAARTIRINIWYPTLDTEGTNPRYLNVFPDEDVFEGASVAKPMDPAGYPVHVHSHGYSGFGGTSSDMMHFFASHGWVAIAPDHTGNTLSEHTDKKPLSISFLRDLDITASLDVLENLPADDPLAGKCQTKNAFMSGHSFGTITTWGSGGAKFDTAGIQAMCENGKFSEPCKTEEIAIFEAGLADARIKAGLPMAGGVGAMDIGYFGNGYDAAQKPFLLMTGSEDPVGGENVFARVTSLDFTWLDFEGGCHQLFALGGCQNFDSIEGWKLVATYAQAFANKHILGDEGAKVKGLLDGSLVISPKVHFQHK